MHARVQKKNNEVGSNAVPYLRSRSYLSLSSLRRKKRQNAKRACVYTVLSRSSKSATKNLRIWLLNFFRIEKLFRVAVIFFEKAFLFWFCPEREDNERKGGATTTTTTTNRIDDDNSGNETRFVVPQLIFLFLFSFVVVVVVREKEQQ